jgi:hypothetical protein
MKRKGQLLLREYNGRTFNVLDVFINPRICHHVQQAMEARSIALPSWMTVSDSVHVQ